ncbi:hypothetical protein [Cognatilysobacter bugurensis]|uniref:Uncharacterized protein n=1 Tax=Cognatilysobacter bugurensis TaxID=543356 RepID=A0A918WAN6_9GAMM|nr:hypothetical protein [Lysobacter bugurensis]GHA86203.1 hypothetical protein GCM10007067_25320 [Lysobacter bugurensis]
MALFTPPPAAGLAFALPLPEGLTCSAVVGLAEELDRHSSATAAALCGFERSLSFIAYEMLDRYDADLEEHLAAWYIQPLTGNDSHLSEAHCSHVLALVSALDERVRTAPSWADPADCLRAAAGRLSELCARLYAAAAKAHAAALALLARESSRVH